MNGKAIEILETSLRVRNRIVGVGWYRDPRRFFDESGVPGAAARCEEANRDLLAFVRPPETVPTRGVTVRTVARSPRATAYDVRFDSPLPSGRPENDRVEMRLWIPAGTPTEAPVLLFHHPLFQRRWRKWDWFLAPFRARMPVAAMAAPFHMGRTPRGEFAGEGSVNPNPWWLFAAIRQWTWDQAAAGIVLEERFRLRPAAVMGFSLGAFQTLLASSADAVRLPVISVACTNRYAFGVRHGILSAGLRDGFRRAGIDPPALESMVRSLELEAHVPRLEGRDIFHVRGVHDQVDPPPSGERLELALRPRRSLHLPAGHSSQVFFRRSIAKETWAFFAECGVTAATETPGPRRRGERGASTRVP